VIAFTFHNASHANLIIILYQAQPYDNALTSHRPLADTARVSRGYDELFAECIRAWSEPPDQRAGAY